MIKFLLFISFALLSLCQWVQEGQLYEISNISAALTKEQFQKYSENATIIDTRDEAQYLFINSYWMTYQLTSTSDYKLLLQNIMKDKVGEILLVFDYPKNYYQYDIIMKIFEQTSPKYNVIGYNGFQVDSNSLTFKTEKIKPRDWGKQYTWRKKRQNISDDKILIIDAREEDYDYQSSVFKSIPLSKFLQQKQTKQHSFIYAKTSSEAKLAYSQINKYFDDSTLFYIDGTYDYFDADAVEIQYETDSLTTENQLYFIPVILCLLSHLICTIIFIAYVWSKRQVFPHKQNSPLLTCTAHLLLFISNLCLIITRIVIDQKGYLVNIRELCQVFNFSIGPLFLLPDVIFTFCQETIVFLYFLKLIRYFPVYQQKYYNKYTIYVFKRQWLILLIAIGWGLIVAMTAFIMKIIDRNKDTISDIDKGFSNSGFQFYMFLCDSKCTYINPWVQNPLYFSKIILYMGLFLFAYIWSQKVSQQLNFRGQYVILLLLYFAPIMIQSIYHLCNRDKDLLENFPQNWDKQEEHGHQGTRCQSTAYLVYYVYLICNLLASTVLLYLYFQRSDEEQQFVLDAQFFLNNLHYVAHANKETKKALNQYAFYTNKEKYMRIYYNVQPSDLPLLQIQNKLDEWMEENFQQIAQEIQELRHRDKLQYDRLTHHSLSKFMKAQRRREYIERKVQQIKAQWAQTNSFAYIYKEMVKGSIYNEKLIKLKLL